MNAVCVLVIISHLYTGLYKNFVLKFDFERIIPNFWRRNHSKLKFFLCDFRMLFFSLGFDSRPGIEPGTSGVETSPLWPRMLTEPGI